MGTLLEKIKNDKKNYSKHNTSEQIVIDAHYFSSYRGTFVLKLPIGRNAFSFGIIGIGHKAKGVSLVRHEYGHRVQLRNMGILRYIFGVAIPSLTANILNRLGRLPYDYYGSLWEHEADILGRVEGRNAELWPKDAYRTYLDLIRLFIVSPKNKK